MDRRHALKGAIGGLLALCGRPASPGAQAADGRRRHDALTCSMAAEAMYWRCPQATVFS